MTSNRIDRIEETIKLLQVDTAEAELIRSMCAAIYAEGMADGVTQANRIIADMRGVQNG